MLFKLIRLMSLSCVESYQTYSPEYYLGIKLEYGFAHFFYALLISFYHSEASEVELVSRLASHPLIYSIP